MCLEEKNVLIDPDNGIYHISAAGKHLGSFFAAVNAIKLADDLAIKYGQKTVPCKLAGVTTKICEVVNSINNIIK